MLQRLADVVIEAAHRAARVENLPFLKPVEKKAPIYQTGNVLFAAPEKEEETTSESSAEKNASGITLPRSHLILLVCAAATIMFALGWALAPWIQSEGGPVDSHEVALPRAGSSADCFGLV